MRDFIRSDSDASELFPADAPVVQAGLRVYREHRRLPVSDKDNGLLHTAVYTVYCFEVAKDVQQQDFPWDDQGVEQLKAWLQERYDHYTREGSL